MGGGGGGGSLSRAVGMGLNLQFNCRAQCTVVIRSVNLFQ